MIKLGERYSAPAVKLKDPIEIIERVILNLTLWGDCEEDNETKCFIRCHIKVMEQIKKLIQEGGEE